VALRVRRLVNAQLMQGQMILVPFLVAGLAIAQERRRANRPTCWGLRSNATQVPAGWEERKAEEPVRSEKQRTA
jgi:hypothetical protein